MIQMTIKNTLILNIDSFIDFSRCLSMSVGRADRKRRTRSVFLYHCIDVSVNVTLSPLRSRRLFFGSSDSAHATLPQSGATLVS